MNKLIFSLILFALVPLADFYSKVSTDASNKQDQMLTANPVKKSHGLLIFYVARLASMYRFAKEHQAKAKIAKEGKKKQFSVMMGNWKMIAKK